MTEEELERTQSSDLSPEVAEEERRILERTWDGGRGFFAWLTNTDHKSIGMRTVVTAFIFFSFAGVLALLMRLQLMRPENSFLGPDQYNQFFTTHGSAMMFLFAVPVMEGMALYLVPLMVGTRNVAFPRMNLYGYYVYLFAGILLFGGLLINIGPDAGWFSYVPLSGPEYGIGKRVDLWSQMVSLTEIAALVGAVEIITTVLKLRAPDMSLNRIPLYVWSVVVTSFMIIFAMPAVMLSSTLLSMDRLSKVSTHFFNHAEGGDPILWQHLFWFFGHPEVYIIFIPATGFRLVDHRHIRTAKTVRLHGARSDNDRDRVHRLRRMGPSYVRHAAAAAWAKHLYGLEHAHRHPERRADILLAGNALARKMEP